MLRVAYIMVSNDQNKENTKLIQLFYVLFH